VNAFLYSAKHTVFLNRQNHVLGTSRLQNTFPAYVFRRVVLIEPDNSYNHTFQYQHETQHEANRAGKEAYGCRVGRYPMVLALDTQPGDEMNCAERHDRD
jgi:hypothetical protein